MKKLTMYVLVLGLTILSLPLVANNNKDDKNYTKKDYLDDYDSFIWNEDKWQRISFELITKK